MFVFFVGSVIKDMLALLMIAIRVNRDNQATGLYVIR